MASDQGPILPQQVFEVVKSGENTSRGELLLTPLEANWLRVCFRTSEVPFKLREKTNEHDANKRA